MKTRIARKLNRWIPITEALPDTEVTLLVTYKDNFGYHRVARAFYEDGNMRIRDSMRLWTEFEKAGAEFVPQGWYEFSEFIFEFSIVNAYVLAWMPMTEPYRGK